MNDLNQTDVVFNRAWILKTKATFVNSQVLEVLVNLVQGRRCRSHPVVIDLLSRVSIAPPGEPTVSDGDAVENAWGSDDYNPELFADEVGLFDCYLVAQAGGQSVVSRRKEDRLGQTPIISGDTGEKDRLSIKLSIRTRVPSYCSS